MIETRNQKSICRFLVNILPAKMFSTIFQSETATTLVTDLDAPVITKRNR